MRLQTPMLSIPSALMIGLLSLSTFSSWLGDLKSGADNKSAKLATLDAQQLDLKIAEKRFANGCSEIVQNGIPVSLKNNMPIFGRGIVGADNNSPPLPLADGTVVCSAQDGGTAVMSGGVTTQFAQNLEASRRYFGAQKAKQTRQEATQ